jgi:hypothetical protein
MATSKAQLRAAAKWRRENMRSVTIAFCEDIVQQIEEAADREGITRDRWLKNKVKQNLEETMTTTITIEQAIESLKATKPHQLNLPEAMAFAVVQAQEEPIYLSGFMASVKPGFPMSDTIAHAALKSLEQDGLIEGYWQKAEGRGRPRRMYKLVNGADVSAIAALDVCGGVG